MNVVEYAKTFIGVNYKFGGNNAIEGFDCSGLINEVLAAVGVDPAGRDTAQSFYNYFLLNGITLSTAAAGALVFYGENPDKISHIALCLNPWQVIEAGGGDSTTLTVQDAAKKTAAAVRVRPFGRRKDIVRIVLPQYPVWAKVT